MKKLVKILMALTLVAAMALSFAACGDTTEVAEKPVVEANPAVAEYVENGRGDVQAVSNETISMDIEARGNSVVYICKYNEVGYSDELKAALKEQEVSMKESLDEALTSIKSECPEVESVIYEYYSNDDKLVYSFEVK